VSSAAHREQQVVIGGEPDAGYDVGHAAAPRNDGWAAIDHAVPDPACLVVVRITRPDQCSLERAGEHLDGFRAEHQRTRSDHDHPPRWSDQSDTGRSP
jgi:hypothetical protein